MHRFILGLKPGDGFSSDHINGDGLDNRRANLRVVTTAQNNLNTRIRKDNKSGYKGVSILTCYVGRVMWQASIRLNGKQVYLGKFDTPEQAYAAYCVAAKEHHGEFARLA